ncbi:hypothetical protein WJX82_008151 [Trebouxia sp. C0006]
MQEEEDGVQSVTEPEGGSQEFAQIFMRVIFAKHGLPTGVVTDRAGSKKFMAKQLEIIAKEVACGDCLYTVLH